MAANCWFTQEDYEKYSVFHQFYGQYLKQKVIEYKDIPQVPDGADAGEDILRDKQSVSGLEPITDRNPQQEETKQQITTGKDEAVSPAPSASSEASSKAPSEDKQHDHPHPKPSHPGFGPPAKVPRLYKQRIRFPRESFLTSDQQKKYLDLYQKYARQIPPNPTLLEVQEMNMFKELQVLVGKEQEEFLNYSQYLAEASRDIYENIHPEADLYMQMHIERQQRRVQQYPRYFTHLDVVPLPSVHTQIKWNLPFYLQQMLLHMGNVPRVFPHVQTGALPQDFKKVNSRFPADIPLPNDQASTYMKQVCSQDSNADRLAAKYQADVVISSSGLQCLLDNLPPAYERVWQMPVIIKEVTDEKGVKKKVVFIDKPFPPTHMSIRAKLAWYYKFAFKAQSVRPNDKKMLNLSKMTKVSEKQTEVISKDLKEEHEPEEMEMFEADQEDMFSTSAGAHEELETFGTGLSKSVSEKTISSPRSLTTDTFYKSKAKEKHGEELISQAEEQRSQTGKLLSQKEDSTSQKRTVEENLKKSEDKDHNVPSVKDNAVSKESQNSSTDDQGKGVTKDTLLSEDSVQQCAEAETVGDANRPGEVSEVSSTEATPKGAGSQQTDDPQDQSSDSDGELTIDIPEAPSAESVNEDENLTIDCATPQKEDGGPASPPMSPSASIASPVRDAKKPQGDLKLKIIPLERDVGVMSPKADKNEKEKDIKSTGTKHRVSLSSSQDDNDSAEVLDGNPRPQRVTRSMAHKGEALADMSVSEDEAQGRKKAERRRSETKRRSVTECSASEDEAPSKMSSVGRRSSGTKRKSGSLSESETPTPKRLTRSQTVKSDAQDTAEGEPVPERPRTRRSSSMESKQEKKTDKGSEVQDGKGTTKDGPSAGGEASDKEKTDRSVESTKDVSKAETDAAGDIQKREESNESAELDRKVSPGDSGDIGKSESYDVSTEPGREVQNNESRDDKEKKETDALPQTDREESEEPGGENVAKETVTEPDKDAKKQDEETAESGKEAEDTKPRRRRSSQPPPVRPGLSLFDHIMQQQTGI